MRLLFCRFIIAIFALSIASCDIDAIKGSDTMIEADYIIESAINEISVCNTMTLTLSDEVDSGEVMIEANDNIISRIYLNSDDEAGTLSVELVDGDYRNITINVKVCENQFRRVTASGASNIVCDATLNNHDSYEIELSGSSKFRGRVESKELEMELSGASQAEIYGASESAAVKCSGSSSVDGKNFSSNKAMIDISGSSVLKIGVSDIIAGVTSGASAVIYYGDGVSAVTSSGVSSVRNEK